MSIFRVRLLASTFMAGIVMLAGPAVAQDVPVGTDTGADASTTPEVQPAVAENADIVVTGSRIVRSELRSSTPILAVGRDDIARTGQTNVAEVLRREPIFATGTSQQNSNFQVNGNGLNLLDLRGLGVDRTLVLINGRRVVAGLGGSNAVDINMIPTDLVERVDTITGGASAVYGSDAMAGVVNFILKDRFTGIELNAQNGISSRGDTNRYRVSGTIGTNFAGDRGNIWINGVYDVDKGLLSRDRSFSANDRSGLSIFSPAGAFSLNGTVFDITGTGDQGAILANDYTFASSGTLKQGFVQNIDGYNRNNFRRLIVPVDRYLANAGLTFKIADSVKFYAEAAYGKTKSSIDIEPYATAGGDPDVDGAGSIDVPGISLDNPFIPAPIANAIAARNSDATPDNDVRYIAFRRRLGDIFNRNSTNDRDFYRAVAGLKGDLGLRWKWDVSYVYGKTSDHTVTDAIPTDRFANALDAVLLGGQIVCRSAAARADGCQPLNIFGNGAPSQAAINYVRRDGKVVTALDTEIEQQVATANLSGSLFRLPGGDVKAAFGAEYRHERSSDDWDADTNAGNTLGNFISDTSGSFDVKDVFGELDVPIFADRPFLHYLGFEGAARYDDYSTIGGVFSWKAGGAWAPTRDIRFRAEYSRANRAPNVGELFSSQSETFPGSRTLDPCDGVTAARTNTYDAACRAIPAIAAAIANTGSFSYSDAEIQSINGFDGGNPSLKEETANTWTIGAVFTPTFAKRLNVSIDYYHIKVKSAINSQPREETVKSCLLDPASAGCGGQALRLPNGKLTRVDALNINTGSFLTSGIDVAARYRQPIAQNTSVNLQLNYTHLLKHQRTPFDGAAPIDELGQLQNTDQTRLGSGYKDRFTLDTIVDHGPASLSWTVRYFGPIKDTLDPATAPDPSLNNVRATWYHDFQLRYRIGDQVKMEWYLGVNNAFDRQPPLLPNGDTASGLFGVETSQEYDVIGRYFYTGIQIRL